MRFAGWSVWITEAEYIREPDRYHCCDYIRAHVKLMNRDDDEQTWQGSDWSILEPSGEHYSRDIVLAGDPLGISGGLVHGGVVEGDVWWSIDETDVGDFYIYWEPSNELSHQGRGVWKFTR